MFGRKKKIDKKIRDEIFDYFKIEKTDGGITVMGDFKDKDFADWLCFIHRQIQNILDSKLLRGGEVKNYVNITFYFGGQKVDVAIIKDGGKSPHELLQEKSGV